ncbi:MAG: penicillin-binding protein 2 [Burkholderiaceae bacterium]|nr:penicillin-binding protein 2 [Burkholderiaceae bacterium]
MAVLRNVQFDLSRFRRRVMIAGLLVLFAFSLLLARLIYLQIFRHDDLLEQADNNRITAVPTVPNRGLILDRNGVVLATNYSAYTLEITPSKAGDLDGVIEELSKIIAVHPRDKKRLKKLLEESKGLESLPIRTRLTDAEVAIFSAQRFRFPGVDVKARLYRNYPFGEIASHVIGYIGRINQADKERLEESEDEGNYRGTDYIGKLGIEQSFEKRLHGITGVEDLETSAAGRAVRKLASSPATPGDTIVLSIDIKLQQMIEEMFGERRGAVVALDPKSGEVLAFVSKPTFDPNLFVEGIDSESWKELSESIDKPLLNRALRGTYPPGSTYKPFMAMAALQSGKRSATAVINDAGSWTFGGHTFRSHGDGGLGGVDMYRSIVKSSNVYYYSLANELGVDAMHDFMKPLGFGQITGIDINGEVRGVLPSQEWKRNAYKRPELKKWYAGETISLGIGQGYNNFTMLQLAQATAILANGGLKYKPKLVIATQDAASHAKQSVANSPPENLGYAPENVAVVRNAMVGVTKEGTSVRSFAGAGYLSGGKTGTAQAVSIGRNEKYNASRLDEHQRDHALYIAFAPAEDPKIALAVVVENAGFGSDSAAPITRRIFDYWLLNQYPNAEDMAALQKGQAGAPIGKPRVASEVPMVTSARAGTETAESDTAVSSGGVPPSKPVNTPAPALPVQTPVPTTPPAPASPLPAKQIAATKLAAPAKPNSR